jgi:hypothetical protein
MARGQTLEQLWFSGAHADVGGGYPGDHPVTHLSLRWMLKKASACGLGVEMIPTPAESELLSCQLHDSFGEFFGGLFSFFHKRYYRPIGRPDQGPQKVDLFVRKRLSVRTDYRPKNDGLFIIPLCDETWYQDVVRKPAASQSGAPARHRRAGIGTRSRRATR